MAISVSTVAIHDGLVYAAELAGYLNCLDAQTGKKLWEYDLKASTWSSPYYVDGKVYMGTDDGTLYVFRHGKERKIPAKIDMSEALTEKMHKMEQKYPVAKAKGKPRKYNELD